MISTLDDAAFARLYETCLGGVFNYCLFCTGDTAVAEELAAEAFARAWTARGSYRHAKGEFSTWLFAIARRAVVDWQRQRTRHPLVALDPSAPDGDESPDMQAEVNVRHDQLRLLVQTLPPADQELVALKFGAGMTNRAIARVLNRSESAIGTALHKLMRKLREDWKVTDA